MIGWSGAASRLSIQEGLQGVGRRFESSRPDHSGVVQHIDRDTDKRKL